MGQCESEGQHFVAGGASEDSFKLAPHLVETPATADLSEKAIV